jgi:starch synthase
LENQEYYELRSNTYGYSDDAIRFALLSRGALEFLNTDRRWKPDVVVCTDWMAGYFSNYLKTDYAHNEYLNELITVFSIHNLSSQGTEKPERFIPESERDDGNGALPGFFEDRIKKVNAMKRGIVYSDVINTVSKTYANEITTEEYGEGLDNLLREKRSKLCGILNGIDYETNNPATDAMIASRFTLRNLEARVKNKLALQARLGLPQKAEVFTIGIVSRLTRQKGFGLLMPIIEAYLRYTKAQLMVVGTGDTELMDFFNGLGKKYPDQVAAHLQYDDALPHLVFSGCDAILIPSKFEPCGLTQMEAMRYGAVPIARKTGGLADTIDDFSPGNKASTGFLFENMDSQELLIALTRAYVNWRHKNEWKTLQKRIMEKNFSWETSAREYAALFKKVIGEKRGK